MVIRFYFSDGNGSTSMEIENDVVPRVGDEVSVRMRTYKVLRVEWLIYTVRDRLGCNVYLGN